MRDVQGENLLLIGQIHERVTFPLLLYVLIGPAMTLLLLLELGLLLLVHVLVDPTKQE